MPTSTTRRLNCSDDTFETAMASLESSSPVSGGVDTGLDLDARVRELERLIKANRELKQQAGPRASFLPQYKHLEAQ